MHRAVLVLLALAACGGEEPVDITPAGRPVGRTCTDTAQCADGLECLAQPDPAEWCDQESYCTIACTEDPECVEALGEGHICVDWCGAALCFEGSSG